MALTRKKHPNESTKKLLEQVSEVSKIAEHKINIQKPILYTSNEHVENKIKNNTINNFPRMGKKKEGREGGRKK